MTRLDDLFGYQARTYCALLAGASLLVVPLINGCESSRSNTVRDGVDGEAGQAGSDGTATGGSSAVGSGGVTSTAVGGSASEAGSDDATATASAASSVGGTGAATATTGEGGEAGDSSGSGSGGGDTNTTDTNTTGTISQGPALGEPCETNGQLACNGAAQKLRLICQAGEWQNNGTCSADENCEQASGVCAPIDDNCDGLNPGDTYCDEDNVRRCNADFVSAAVVDECTAACRVFEGQGQCVVVTQVAAGMHTCAVLSTGQLRCWGYNGGGQLGLGHTDPIGDQEFEMPPPDVPLGEKAIHVAVGTLAASVSHTCAILEGGAVRCWGSNTNGQLGLGHTEVIGSDELPTENVPLDTPAKQLALGVYHSCALLEGGTVRCWGLAYHLGIGAGEDVGDDPGETPTQNVPLGAPATQIAAGQWNTCAVLETGAVRCWGDPSQGALGIPDAGSLDPAVIPTIDIDVGGTASHVAVGNEYVCAVIESPTSQGDIVCWGDGGTGRLGLGNTDSIGLDAGDMPPTPSYFGTGTAKAVTGSVSQTCTLLRNGAVRCWGATYGYGGALDVIGDEAGELPPGDLPLGGQAVALSAKRSNACALLATGDIRCWGANSWGQLGLGHANAVEATPADIGDISVF